jgi:hypothetical protein
MLLPPTNFSSQKAKKNENFKHDEKKVEKFFL